MPHQRPQSSKATAQNAATGPRVPNDSAREEQVSVRPEPRSYAAPDVADATVTGPAATELGEYADEGDPMGEVPIQQGANHTQRPYKTEAQRGQGPKTKAANAAIAKGGLYRDKR